MNKMKVKLTSTYDDLIKNSYGGSRPRTMVDCDQFDGLIAQYYGKPRRRPGQSNHHRQPVVFSLSLDQTEILTQPVTERYPKKDVAQNSATSAPYEEYVVEAVSEPAIHSMVLKELSLPATEPAPEEEYKVDVLHHLEKKEEPKVIMDKVFPALIAKKSANETTNPQKKSLDQPIAITTTEASKATDVDFMEDLQSILSGQKMYDPVSKKTVEKEKHVPPSKEAARNGLSVQSAPDAQNEQAIFDRIAQSMQYANTFDLGSVELDNRFTDFDRLFDLQQKTAVKKKTDGDSAPASTPSPTFKVDNEDFMKDLDLIRGQVNANDTELEPSANSLSDSVDDESTSIIPEIESLNLAEPARKAAYTLKQKHPSIVFTSGRRNKQQQARAMAGNVILNRKWIEETYAKTHVRDECQTWVDDHPDQQSIAEIEQGLLEVLNKYSDIQLGVLSKHISGMAFDVQPVEGGEDIMASIKALDGLDKFLEKEGSLVRWHAQFK